MLNRIIKIVQDDNDLMHLTWVINNICTNACSYCPSELHAGTNHNYDWDNARNFFEVLFKRYPKIHCSVSGGEASVSPFFREIVEIFHKAGHTIGVTSNAAKPVKYWDEISPFLNYICFSYHPEFPDDKFVEKISAAGKNTLVTARVMMHPKHWSECVNMYNQLSALEHINTESVRIFNWGGRDTTAHVYTVEQLEWLTANTGTNRFLPHLHGRAVANINSTIYLEDGTIDTNPNTVDYINAGQTNFNGYVCEAGLKELFIDYLGDVYIGNCMINGSIGNINAPEDIQWPTAAVVCNKNICHCTTDVNINKRLP